MTNKKASDLANECYLRMNSYVNPNDMNGIEKDWICKVISQYIMNAYDKGVEHQKRKFYKVYRQRNT